MRQFRQGLLVALAMAIGGLGMSCSSGPAAAPQKVTYRCLLSSCNATVVCNEGDPVPEHHGKPMMR